MNNWEALVKAALLGTRRETTVPAAGQKELAALLEPLPEGKPAHRLLCTAGTADLFEQVGNAPQKTMRDGPLFTAVNDDRPLCNRQAAYYLSRMVSGPFRTLLPEFLEALRERNQRIPDTLMPNILAHGAKVVAVRPAILPLLSQKDRRLAAANPTWSYASPDMDSWAGLRRIWDDLAPVGRQSLIKQLRSATANIGRELVESTWKIEGDNQRLRLLKALEIRLSMEDEPFLEMALDDRSQLIRRQAAELLAYLPDSRLAQRMAPRVKRFLTWHPDQEKQIQVSFAAIDPDMIRDGVHGGNSKSLARVRAQQLTQLVSAVPLAFWSANWHESPRIVLQALYETNWTRTLFAGFTWAAYRQKNAIWAKEILWMRGMEGGTNKLLDLISNTDFEQLVKRLVAQEQDSDPLLKRGQVVMALHRRSVSFDQQLTELLLPFFAYHFKQEDGKKAPGSLVRSTFLKIARSCPVGLDDHAADQFRETAPQWRSAVNEFFSILKFRREMIAAVESKK